MNPVEPLQFSDLAAVRNLLSRLSLPVEDCHSSENRFFGCWKSGQLIACGGLQLAENAVLMRSLAVEPVYQGQGLGRQLVDFMLAEARQADFAAVYLLTEHSSTFFESVGFQRIDRCSVPDEIASTAQFSSLCPESAVCLMKALRVD